MALAEAELAPVAVPDAGRQWAASLGPNFPRPPVPGRREHWDVESPDADFC
ncbi:hypothetical protein Pla86_16420 [Planctomycetes bacterium Pla86]|uniref:Uncharacterized protein n=1 Tax=Engelhardtia mirabilis TaxID=2528011 RepID=A0A518BHV4_9BACT|nr:hypothetical protein Pla133_16430 [Planctomycetes bacterium Pla133]QDV00893.1 hypothetical protein Pla86_16420 [Planctomycetes bacterium Pla86]